MTQTGTEATRPGEAVHKEFCQWHYNLSVQGGKDFEWPCRRQKGCVLDPRLGKKLEHRLDIVLLDGITIGQVVEQMGADVWMEQKHNHRSIREAVKQIIWLRENGRNVTRTPQGDVSNTSPPHCPYPVPPSECLETGTFSIDAANIILGPMIRSLWPYGEGLGENWEQGVRDLLEQLGPRSPQEAMVACMLIGSYLKVQHANRLKGCSESKRMELGVMLSREYRELQKEWERLREISDSVSAK